MKRMEHRRDRQLRFCYTFQVEFQDRWVDAVMLHVMIAAAPGHGQGTVRHGRGGSTTEQQRHAGCGTMSGVLLVRHRLPIKTHLAGRHQVTLSSSAPVPSECRPARAALLPPLRRQRPCQHDSHKNLSDHQLLADAHWAIRPAARKFLSCLPD